MHLAMHAFYTYVDGSSSIQYACSECSKNEQQQQQTNNEKIHRIISNGQNMYVMQTRSQPHFCRSMMAKLNNYRSNIHGFGVEHC